MLPGDPNTTANRGRKPRGILGSHEGAGRPTNRMIAYKRGYGTLPMQPDDSKEEKRSAAAENLARIQASRPLKPPQRKPRP